MADLFEEYKEALKKGHVAVLRGELDEAIANYRVAARIAPDRPLPYSSLGGVLLRLGRTAEAVAAYEEAVRRGPTDETALGGQSDAFLAAGRRAEAAEVLDRLARIQVEKGRQAEGLATRGLARAVRAAGGIAEPDTGEVPTPQAEAAESTVPATVPSIGELAAGAGVSAAPEALAGVESAPSSLGARPESLEAASAHEPEPAAPATPPTPDELVGTAEQARLEGHMDEAVQAYVRAASGYREVAALDAGLDACQQALTLAPGSPDVHLAMAGLYFDRGWQERAADKLVLLDRLLQLQEPNGWRDRLLSLASEHEADDPRLAALTARGAPANPGSSGV
jgi:tetratricopeptide (TPR) repeat protein